MTETLYPRRSAQVNIPKPRNALNVFLDGRSVSCRKKGGFSNRIREVSQ